MKVKKKFLQKFNDFFVTIVAKFLESAIFYFQKDQKSPFNGSLGNCKEYLNSKCMNCQSFAHLATLIWWEFIHWTNLVLNLTEFRECLIFHTTIRKVNFFFPKNSILTKPHNFLSFSLKFFLTIFLVKSKLSTAKKSKTTTFSRVFHPKNSTIF